MELRKIRVGIIGGAGYTGGELLRILIHHAQVEICFVHSNSNANNCLYDVHTDLLGDTELRFCGDEVLKTLSTGDGLDEIDVLFLCVGHGDASKFLSSTVLNKSIKIIDLSQDFRIKENKHIHTEGVLTDVFHYPLPTTQYSQLPTRYWTYGLPELDRESIKTAQNIANPGCFATSIQLALLPLASNGFLRSEIHISATTGSTGAGQGLSATSHFSWRNNNLSVYKAFEHQHLHEISQTLKQVQQGFNSEINLIPQRGDFTRGIMASMYTECSLSLDKAFKLYEDYYSGHPFTHISKKNIDLKQVVNTNKCLIYLEKHGNKLFIVSIIDNLLKGASGQAVQNMNLMFGLEETSGLKLKGTGF